MGEAESDMVVLFHVGPIIFSAASIADLVIVLVAAIPGGQAMSVDDMLATLKADKLGGMFHVHSPFCLAYP